MRITPEELRALVSLIEYINELHKNHSQKWLEEIQKAYNLKKKQIRHICKTAKGPEGDEVVTIDIEFLNYMNNYCEELHSILFNPYFDFIDVNIDLSLRIKDPDSRVAKLMYYMNGKSEHGMVNINKCLNDLLGFRVWIKDFEHSEENINLIINQLGNENIKIYDASKLEYKAMHVYFSNGNNKFFPWELQIWNRRDHKSNIYSHSVHKQGYTKWVENYKNEASLFEEVKVDV